MGMVKEFRDFAMRGNVVDLAVGVVIGGAFGTIVKSLVADIIMPPIGVLTSGVDFSQSRILLEKVPPGATAEQIEKIPAIMYGSFINNVISFIIIAFAIFMVVRLMNKAQSMFEGEKEAEAAKEPPAEVRLLTEIRDALVKN